MGSVNKAILVGNLGRDAEMRFTQGGTPVSTVSLATTEKWTDREGNKKEDTQWHRVVIWGKTAEALNEYLLKGKQIYVDGRIQTREWTNKEGQKVRTTEIRADRIVLLGGGGGSNGERSSRSGGGKRRDRHVSDEEMARDDIADDAPADAPSDDDIPFAWLLPLLVPMLGVSSVLL